MGMRWDFGGSSRDQVWAFIRVSDSQISDKAKSVLEFGSPFFDVLWPIIFDVADRNIQNTLHLTHPYFKQMWKRADSKRKYDIAKADYARLIAQYPDYPSDSIIPASPMLWYSWGLYGGRSELRDRPEEFSAIADVDPEPARHHSYSLGTMDVCWVFVSRTKDVTLTAMC